MGMQENQNVCANHLLKLSMDFEGIWHAAETCWSVAFHRFAGLVVKASASSAADLGSIPASGVDLFLGQVISVT